MSVNVPDRKTVEIMATIKIRYILPLLLIGMTACKEKIYSELYGNWAVLELNYKGSDISDIVRTSRVSISKAMIIDNMPKVFTLPHRFDSINYAVFRRYSKDGNEWMEVYNADDARYNGEYLIDIYVDEKSNYGKNISYGLELKSKDMFIFGYKTVAKF